jgi:hypothetical protein
MPRPMHVRPSLTNHCCVVQTADILENVTCLALRARLKECRGVKTSISCDMWSLLAGRVNGVKIHGEGWRSPLNLTAQVLEVSWEPRCSAQCSCGRLGRSQQLAVATAPAMLQFAWQRCEPVKLK